MKSTSPLLRLALCLGAACCLPAANAAPGSYLRPFADNALWNSRPVAPVLGTFAIPTSSYFPSVAEGAYSTGVFKASTSDPAVVVQGPVGATGIWDPDSETYRTGVTIAHWPATVTPASGSDGHADIVDEAAGVIHSFFKLTQVNGVWRAQMYAWSPLNGRGWGDPSHYYQGARATAVPASAGLIRKHEVNDGQPQYRHALAMSLTFNALAPSPTYLFPATAADGNAATTNTGQIPEGTLLMLPSSFDANKITTPALKKIVATLKTYGGFVVDRNVGTPFAIYVENGSGFNLHQGGWNGTAANELQVIRAALRPVLSTSGWMDANGAYFSPSKNMNLMSMRGTWSPVVGTASATAAYDTWQQAVVLPASAGAVEYRNVGNRNVVPPTWAQPTAGASYKFTANATGGAKLRLDIIDATAAKVLYSTGYVANGASVTFAWPAARYRTAVYVSTVAGQGAVVSGRLVQP